MSTLLLRMAAPMQSWGVDSKFDRRYTGRAPSKSGVIGLCAAALGYRRDEDAKIARLANLKFGVRTDKPGVLMKDFHTAKSAKSAYVTIRYYLADAVFLVGLEGDDNYLRGIDDAIRAPMFPLYLGRRSCPPEGYVSCGVVPESLREALEKHATLAEPRRGRSDAESGPRIVIDAVEGDYFIRDLPRSFNPEHRKFDFRRVCEFEAHMLLRPGGAHDALGELEVP